MSLGLSHIRRPLMLKRLLDWIIPDHALQVSALTPDVEESRVWARAAQARADQGDVTDTTQRLIAKLNAQAYLHPAASSTTTTLGAIPCTCSPRHDPPDYTDPNCWACNRG
jgi:hypothetical protein